MKLFQLIYSLAVFMYMSVTFKKFRMEAILFLSKRKDTVSLSHLSFVSSIFQKFAKI